MRWISEQHSWDATCRARKQEIRQVCHGVLLPYKTSERMSCNLVAKRHSLRVHGPRFRESGQTIGWERGGVGGSTDKLASLQRVWRQSGNKFCVVFDFVNKEALGHLVHHEYGSESLLYSSNSEAEAAWSRI